MLLDGPHLVSDGLSAGVTIRQAAVRADALGGAELAALVERLTRARIDVTSVAAPVMAALSPVKSPSAIVALADRPHTSPDRLYAAPSPLVAVAADVQDPGNLGAIVRVAESAGATGLIAAGRCADPYGWKTLRGSMGSGLRLPILPQRDVAAAVGQARLSNCRIVALIPRRGRSLYDLDYTAPIAILIGGEGPGLPAAVVEEADDRVTIPMQAPVESLNAAVATALVLYEARRQRDRHGLAVS